MFQDNCIRPLHPQVFRRTVLSMNSAPFTRVPSFPPLPTSVTVVPTPELLPHSPPAYWLKRGYVVSAPSLYIEVTSDADRMLLKMENSSISIFGTLCPTAGTTLR